MVTGDAPYVETNDEAMECSFRSLEFVNANFIAEGNRISVKQQFDAGFLQEVKYSEWVANIVPVPKKDGKKHNPEEWEEECQKAFDKIKQYLATAPILSPPSPDRPLILYLTVFDNSMGCVLGQHDETGKKERILFSEFDIVYVSQKAKKESAIADFLASRALEDYEPLNFNFPNDDLMYVANTEENTQRDHVWRLNFDGASNAMGNGIRAVLNIKMLRVCGDSAFVIYQLKGEWETRDPKLISYRKLVLELADEFDDITFCYLPREENQMADTLATLASLIQVNRLEVMRPIQMSILQYVKNWEYSSQATENDKRTLRRIAIEYALDGEALYKRGKDQVLLICVDAVEARKILEEVHEGICGCYWAFADV
ncbi:uncharacterized protein LOC128033852 [Gossypium raimondii]|uniref:uncharacterized protein LOC128033852 n=1 Tax=Gossypium raimondii TaxID=29730 RepID=UPI00227C8078|nr:uncharacterized protein LOC128033852 [Gossypium raimondii]